MIFYFTNVIYASLSQEQSHDYNKFMIKRPHLTSKKEDSNKYRQKMSNLMYEDHLQISWRAISTTLVTILLLGGGGYLLDQAMNSGIFFLITGLVASYPLSMLIIYKVFKKITKKD